MMKIATHDSSTGERSANLLSLMFKIFSQTQTKTIKEQLDAGVRFFDIRVRKSMNPFHKNKWVLAHGLWTAKTTPDEIFCLLNEYSAKLRIVYEGNVTGEKEQEFLNYVRDVDIKYPDIAIAKIQVKLPQLRTIEEVNVIPFDEHYTTFPIGLGYYKWLIPIPALWDRIYYSEKKFNDEKYNMVDFL